MKFRLIAPLAVLVFAAAAPASAQTVYKCTDANGKVQFLDQPCDKNSGATQQSLDMTQPSREGKRWRQWKDRERRARKDEVYVHYLCIDDRGREYGSHVMVCDDKKEKCSDMMGDNYADSMDVTAMRRCQPSRRNSRRYY